MKNEQWRKINQLSLETEESIIKLLLLRLPSFIIIKDFAQLISIENCEKFIVSNWEKCALYKFNLTFLWYWFMIFCKNFALKVNKKAGAEKHDDHSLVNSVQLNNQVDHDNN